MSDKALRPKIVAARPSFEEAEDAVRTLLRWAGDDPTREGLLDTPSRVVRSYEEFYAGYAIANTTWSRSSGRRMWHICRKAGSWAFPNWRAWLIFMPVVCRHRKR